jgi:hypothetical protein
MPCPLGYRRTKEGGTINDPSEIANRRINPRLVTAFRDLVLWPQQEGIKQ